MQHCWGTMCKSVMPRESQTIWWCPSFPFQQTLLCQFSVSMVWGNKHEHKEKDHQCRAMPHIMLIGVDWLDVWRKKLRKFDYYGFEVMNAGEMETQDGGAHACNSCHNHIEVVKTDKVLIGHVNSQPIWRKKSALRKESVVSDMCDSCVEVYLLPSTMDASRLCHDLISVPPLAAIRTTEEELCLLSMA